VREQVRGQYQEQAHAGPALEPLREPLFRSLWIASVISYTGTWTQNVGAGWLMTSLTMDQPRAPLMVGLVQAATSLPVFLVVLVAGALADMVDRRRLLLTAQIWMTLAAAALGVLTLLGMVGPWTLLAFTFLLGFGNVMNDPAWQAITPEIVSARCFAAAVALNSAGFNVARAVGPAIGGVVVAMAGSGAAFLLNAASFLGVIVFLYRWKRAPQASNHPAQRVWHAVGAGLDYIRGAPAVRAVLVRTGLFSLFASALWAMLPLIAKEHGSIVFGTLVACLGAGAVVGATLIPALRRRMSLNRRVALATAVFAVVTCVAGVVRVFPVLCLVLFLGGMAWLSILASLNLSAQTMSPQWVRARALSAYLLVLQGGMAAGGALWGALAGEIGITRALAVAAAGLTMGLLFARRYRLGAAWVELPPPVTTGA